MQESEPKESRMDRLRGRGGKTMVRAMLKGLSGFAQLFPMSRPERHDVEVIKDIPYKEGGRPEFLLDVYRPKGRQGLLPVMLYIHGGAFQILSKETHWVFGLGFAKRDFVVFNINYRLAPQNPCPSALEDASDALMWVLKHAHEYGGDVSRLVISGESAGANLTTALTLAASYEHPMPWARQVWDAKPSIKGVIPACGLLQVSDVERFIRRKKLHPIVADRILEVPKSYFPKGTPYNDPEIVATRFPLADPLIFLERGEAPQRPLPPFMTFAGTADPILDDSRRLKTALDALGVPCEMHYYSGGIHAFHALVWGKKARQCWRDQFSFLKKILARD